MIVSNCFCNVGFLILLSFLIVECSEVSGFFILCVMLVVNVFVVLIWVCSVRFMLDSVWVSILSLLWCEGRWGIMILCVWFSLMCIVVCVS